MHIRSLLAGVGLATVVGVGSVVAVSAASAEPTSGTTSSSPTTAGSSASSCPRADLRTEIAAYLKANPDVKTELQKIRALPKDQRAAERKTYLAAHPDVKQQLKTFRADRRSAGWEAIGNKAAILTAHPDLADLFKAVGAAPAGQRQAAAKAYLTQHPNVRTELQQVRQQQRQACHPAK